MARNLKIELVFVRSGLTEWDEQGRIQGRTDLPLSTAGRTEAAKLAGEVGRLLTNYSRSVIYSGPDEASLATAALIADPLAIKARVLDGLQTMDLGLWEGSLESEIESRFPSAARLWAEQPSLVQAPKGEEFEEAEFRLRRSVCEILERSPARAVVFVCRPLPFAMACCWLAGRPSRDVWAVLDAGPPFQPFSLAFDQVRSLLEEMKAGA